MLLVSCALAGFYHPSDVAAESLVFADASRRMADQASSAQRQSRALALGLQDYGEALDLLGGRATDADRERLRGLSVRYNRQFAVLQEEVDVLVEAFDTTFGEAMDRALRRHPGAVRCLRSVSSGPSIPGLGARTRANPDCTGDDLNASIAKAMDADPALKAAIDGLGARSLPAFELEEIAMGEGADHVAVAVFFQKAVPGALKRIRREDEEARLPLEVALEEGATTEDLVSLKPRAAAIDAQTAGKRAALAEPVFERAQLLFDKKAPGTVWCAQPAMFGGCAGTDVTGTVGRVLLDDKKIRRAIGG